MSLEDTARDLFINDALHILGETLLLYDHAITFGHEYQLLWKRTKTRSTYWFFFHRYTASIGNFILTIMLFLAYNKDDIDTSKRVYLARQIMIIFNQIVICVILWLRVYALFESRPRIVWVTLVFSLSLAGAACWALFGQNQSTPDPQLGSHPGLSTKTAIRLAAAWEALFIFDLMIFLLTVTRTYHGWRQVRRTATLSRGWLVYLVFRDGAVYFIIMALATLANIFTFYFCGPFLKGGLSTFASSVSITMMSRLLLNLHEGALKGMYSTVDNTHTMMSTLGFSEPDSTETELWEYDISTVSSSAHHRWPSS